MNFIKSVYFCTTFVFVSIYGDVLLLDTAKNPFVYLEENNYPYENHTVVTEDGYILLLIRIPYDRNENPSNVTRPTVLFVHGIFSLFYDFLNAGPGESIGFEVLEAGYDVWLLNTRGSTYSRKHVSLDPDLNAPAFWNFSWHEIGVFDLPATIDYIINSTSSSAISYVGHSQGTTAFLAFAASRPEYNEKINIAILLASVAYMGNAQFPLLLLLKNNVELAYAIVDVLRLHEVLPHDETVARAGQLLCNLDSPALHTCGLGYEAVFGISNQLNYSMLSVLLTAAPAGGSAKELLHFLQNAHSGEFRQYDYGTTRNKIAYNQTTPPSYNLDAVTTPVALFYGSSDLLVSVIDATRLSVELPECISNNVILGANHVDVLWGTSAVELVHKPAINLLNTLNNRPTLPGILNIL